jgi:hypothetical protein
MGFLSVNVGLAIAMIGAGLLGVACAGALLLARPRAGSVPTTAPEPSP